jgi:RNA polymerase sigma factor (sigma-70 family)
VRIELLTRNRLTLSHSIKDRLAPARKIENPGQNILMKCSRGHARSQEHLYKKYYAYALSVTLRFLPNRDDAREVVNDVFVKVFTRLRDEIPDNFTGWLRRIAVHTAVDHYRANRTRKELLPDIVDPQPISVPEDVLDRLSAEDILNLLEQLNETPRMVFILYEIEGYHHDEIAVMLSIEAATSRSHLFRAKAFLRNSLLTLSRHERSAG